MQNVDTSKNFLNKLDSYPDDLTTTPCDSKDSGLCIKIFNNTLLKSSPFSPTFLKDFATLEEKHSKETELFKVIEDGSLETLY